MGRAQSLRCPNTRCGVTMKRAYIRPVVDGVQVLAPIGWYCVACGRFIEEPLKENTTIPKIK